MNPRPLARTLGGLCAAALLLTVPVFAAWAVTPGATDTGTALAPSDDVVANGLRIVEAPPEALRPEVRPQSEEISVAKVLWNWTYTDRTRPSPGH
jgi:hypothetical protein